MVQPWDPSTRSLRHPGQHGHMDESAAGDDWYVICHVCGTKWAGGSTLLVPHEDLRKR